MRDRPGEDSTEQTLLATIELGRSEANAGRIDAAENTFLEVLAACRGAGGLAEQRAVSSLVTIYSREQRDYETLPMARRLVEFAEAGGDVAPVCRAWAAVAGAFNDLEDRPRTRRAIERLQAAVAELPPHSPERPPHLRIVYGTLSDLALSDGDAEGAMRLLQALRREAAQDLFEGEERWLLLHEAHIELRSGRGPEARRLIDRATSVPAPGDQGALALEYLRIWCQLEIDGPETARQITQQCLARLQRQWPRAHGLSQRIRYLSLIGDLVQPHAQLAALAPILYAFASCAAASRMVQLESFLRRQPPCGELQPDDRIALAEYRQRFRKRHSALLKAVADHLRLMNRTEPWSPFLEVDPDRLTPLCAWCERLRTDEQRWLPVGHFVPQEPALRISHTICPDCLATLEEDMETPS